MDSDSIPRKEAAALRADLAGIHEDLYAEGNECDLDGCNGAMCAACAPGPLQERLLEQDAEICEHGAWQEACAACRELERIERIIAGLRDQWDENARKGAGTQANAYRSHAADRILAAIRGGNHA